MSTFTDGGGFWGSEDALLRLIDLLEASNAPKEEVDQLRQVLNDQRVNDDPEPY